MMVEWIPSPNVLSKTVETLISLLTVKIVLGAEGVEDETLRLMASVPSNTEIDAGESTMLPRPTAPGNPLSSEQLSEPQLWLAAYALMWLQGCRSQSLRLADEEVEVREGVEAEVIVCEKNEMAEGQRVGGKKERTRADRTGPMLKYAMVNGDVLGKKHRRTCSAASSVRKLTIYIGRPSGSFLTYALKGTNKII